MQMVLEKDAQSHAVSYSISRQLNLNPHLIFVLFLLWKENVKWFSLLVEAATLRLKLGPLATSSQL